jgi:hypothetical protein
MAETELFGEDTISTISVAALKGGFISITEYLSPLLVPRKLIVVRQGHVQNSTTFPSFILEQQHTRIARNLIGFSSRMKFDFINETSENTNRGDR